MEEGTPIGESSRQEPRVRVVEVAPSVRNPTGEPYFMTFSQKLNSVDIAECTTDGIRTKGLIAIFAFAGALDDTD
jgi:hypothetical protein